MGSGTPQPRLQSCDLAWWDESKVVTNSTSALTCTELFRCTLKLGDDVHEDF